MVVKQFDQSEDSPSVPFERESFSVRQGKLTEEQDSILSEQHKSSQGPGVVMIRKPLANIYLVESFKKFNYENTDHNHPEVDGAGNGIGMALVQRAQDLAEEKCTIF